MRNSNLKRASHCALLSTSAAALALAAAPAWAGPCAPGATTACSAPGGIGDAPYNDRGGPGGAGNGDGGGATGLIASYMVPMPGSSGVNGNGGAGAAGESAGGAGGGVGANLTAATNFTFAVGFTGSAGAPGSSGFNFAAGGGGGGAGVYFTSTGGVVTANAAITGGAGGVGGASTSGIVGNAGGGGGGGAAVISASAGATFATTVALTGGAGGAGGSGGYGGGGGGGGDGLLVLGDNSAITNTGAITGGAGGAGGAGLTASGTAGVGGAGVNLVGTGSALVTSGTITGGAGSGAGAGAGVVTYGGATISNAGTISGGLDSDGVTRAAAIQFGGTGNTLNLQTGSNLVGALQLAAGAGAAIAAQSSGLSLDNSVALGTGSTVTFDSSTADLTVSGAISGDGAVTATGAGTTTLTGVNTYTGQTTINAGSTLALSGSGSIASSGVTDNGVFDISGAFGASITTLSGSGSVQLGLQKLTLTDANDTFTGTIAGKYGGTGILEIAGGTETLAGNANFSGAAWIDAGARLNLGDGSGSGGMVYSLIENDGALVFNVGAGTNLLRNPGITGHGTVEFQSGTLRLGGNNTYQGATTIDSGATVALVAFGNLNGTSGVVDNGVLDISGALSGASVTTLSGSGGVTLGARTLTLTKANNTFSGVIAGSGGLTIASGTETLTGVNTYTGRTTINAGSTLALSGSGSIAWSSVVQADGAFDISGTSGASITTLSGSGSVLLGLQKLTLTDANGAFTGTIAGKYGGTGILEIAGGTETLAGNANFSGSAWIDAGARLNLGDGSGSGGMVYSLIEDDGALYFNVGAGTNLLDNAGIAGHGTVEFQSGTLRLGGNSTYLGATTIDSGATVALVGNGKLEETSGVVDNGVLDISGTISDRSITTLSGAGSVVLGGRTLSLTAAGGVFSGVISGSGGLTVTGTEALSGENTYTGLTTVNANSELFIGYGTSSGSVAGGVLDNGTVSFGRTDASTYGGAISGTGAVVVAGYPSQWLTLTGENTYSGGTVVNAGATLQLGAGGTAGSIVGDVADNGALVFNRSDTVTFNGAISGSGKLVQAGTGTTILNGSSTVSGQTTISAGRLEVGDAAHPGAVLDSRLGGVSVGAAGTLSGHGAILGAVTNNSGGVVSPGGSIGTLTVGAYTQGANSTLAIEVSPTQASMLSVTGAASLNGKLSLVFDPGTYAPHSYEILAAGSVSGTFSSVDMSGTQGGLVYGLAYKSDQVDLVTAPTRNALVYGDVSTATLDRAQSFASFVEDRFGDAVCANGAADRPRGGDDACHGMGAWAQAIASSDRASGLGAGYGFNNKGAGFVGGIDHRWAGGATLGVAFGYQDDSLSISEASSSARGHAYFGGLYGRWTVGPVKLDGQAFYMNSDWSLSRNVPGYGKASSSPNGDTAGFLVQASAPIGQSGFSPYARLAFAEFNRDGVTETGAGSIGYAIASASSSSTLGEIGFTYAHVYGEAGGRQVVPSLRLGLQKDFSNHSQTVDASLDGVSGTAFAVSYDKPGQTAGVADLSLKAQLTPSFELTGEVRGRFGGDLSEGAATFGGAYRF